MTRSTNLCAARERALRRLGHTAGELGFPVDDALAERVAARWLFLVPHVERMRAWRATAVGEPPVRRQGGQ